MKLIRGISLSLAGLIILALVAAAFMPDTLRVERSIVINKPVDKVFDQVVDLGNWQAWSPWMEMDPQAVTQISTPSRGVGAHWSWDGQKIGKGKLVQEEVEDNKMIRYSLSFEEPLQSTGTDLWMFDSAAVNATQVTWVDEMQMEYPVGRLSALFIKPSLEAQFDKGLLNLKRLVEKEPKPKPVPVAPVVVSDSVTRISGT